MKKILLCLLLISTTGLSQQTDTLTLFDCYDLARKAHPILKNYKIAEEIGNLKSTKVLTNNFPVLNFAAQATYQSDVIDLEEVFSAFPSDMPAPELDALPKDQYKMYVEASKVIYDGGIIKTLGELELASAQTEMQKINVEVFGIKERVNENYFAILLIQKQKEIIEIYREELDQKIDVLQTALENGTINQSTINVLKAEQLNLEQQILELEFTVQSLNYSLSILIGRTVNNTLIEIPEYTNLTNEDILRPEIDLFNLEKNKIDISNELVKKKQYPVIAGFGQFGYGRPGLNMLNPDFDDYYLLGLSVKWNIYDWGQTNKDKQVLTLTKELIGNQEAGFRRNINILFESEKVKIEKLNQLIQKDNDIIQLKEEIVKRASVELENGTITSTDYLSEFNAEKKAKLNKTVHEIELSKAETKLRTILGQL